MYCEKKFFDSRSQKKHEMIHTGEAFTCDTCQKNVYKSKQFKETQNDSCRWA